MNLFVATRMSAQRQIIITQNIPYDKHPSCLFQLFICFIAITCLSCSKQGKQVVLLDTYYNHEVNPETGLSQHYTWNDTSRWGGYSQFGEFFASQGAELSMLNARPTASLLAGSDVYIIVDPDHVKDNPSPNYMDSVAAEVITQWVHDGGHLLVLTNDKENCDLCYINILMDHFGMHYKDTMILQLDIPTAEHPENVYPLQGLLEGVDKMYMRGTCSIVCGENVRRLVWTLDDDVIMAETQYGKGLVVAIADPWIYNEYIGHLLLPDNYDNATPARWLVQHLLGDLD